MLDAIQAQKNFKSLIADVQAGVIPPGLGLMRGARLPFIGALHEELAWPILIVVERMDQALAVADELGFWIKKSSILLFRSQQPCFMRSRPGDS